MELKWNYYQYRKTHDYPVYVRLRQDELNPKFEHLLRELGFDLLADKDSKKIPLNRPHTRVLTVQTAGPKLNSQIHGSDLLDRYGLESLSYQSSMPIYTYRKVGLLALPLSKTLWDLALSQDIALTDQMIGMRVVLVRFLALALSDMGIICYWGTLKDNSVIVMKQNQSFGEAIVIDFSKRIAFFNGGQMSIGNNIKLIRKDKEMRVATPMGREELISFLSVSSCLLSFSGITPAMKKSIYDLSSFTSASYGVTEAVSEL